jgi:hypothetical protein
MKRSRWARTASLVAVAAALAAVPAHSEPTGGIVQISDVGPVGDAAFDADDPRLAFAPDGGIAVYIGEPVDEENEVFARPLDAAGNPTGTQRRVTHVGTDGSVSDAARNPAVAYDPRRNDFVVVWSNAIGFDEDIFAQRVGRDGVPIGPAKQVSEAGGVGPGSDGDSQRPRLAYDPGRDEFLAVWTDSRNGGEGEVRAQRLAGATLAQVGADDFFVSTVGGSNQDANRVDVAFGAGGFLVAWSDVTAGGDEEIFSRRVNSGGGVAGGETRLSLQGATDSDDLQAERPATAFDSASNEFLVAWGGELSGTFGTLGQVFGRRVGAGGAPIGGQFRISQQESQGDADAPAVAADPRSGEYLVAWAAFHSNGEQEIHSQRLTAGGAEVGTNDAQVSDQGPAGDPSFSADAAAVAFNPAAGGFLVAWRGTRSFDTQAVDSEDEIFARAASSPFTPPAPTPTPAPAVPPPPPPAGKPLKATDVIRFPSTHKCVSRRKFRIRLRHPGGVKLVSARVVLNGKRLKVVKGRRLTSAIVLKGLPKGRFTLKITVTTSTGKKLTGKRRYHTCTKKRRSKHPPKL